MHTFLIGAGICIALILICTAVFYEMIAHTWVLLPRLKGKLLQILFTISSTFLAHTLLVWLFGGVMYLLDKQFDFGTLHGAENDDFLPYVYFSGVTYSSVGYGNYMATGGLQLIAVVEAILGLTLIGWSVTFTYLVAQKYLFHRRRPD